MAEHVEDVRAVGDGLVEEELQLRGIAQVDLRPQCVAQEAAADLSPFISPFSSGQLRALT